MDEVKQTIGAEALNEAVAAAGGVTRLAAALGIAYQIVQGWQAEGRRYATPAHYVIAVEQATGVSRHRLRPDVFPVDSVS